MKPINLRELLEQVILGFIPPFKEAGIDYRLSFTDQKILLNVDRVLIARMFDNMINNAIRYGREGKYIDIELRKEENEAIVKIINYGNPIPDADLPNIFEKFYCVDKSRSCGIGVVLVGKRLNILSNEIGQISLNATIPHKAYEMTLGTFFRGSLMSITKMIT